MGKTKSAVSIEWRLFQHRFVVLLGVLTLLLIVPSILDTAGFSSIVTRVVVMLLFSASLIAAMYAVSRGRVAQIVGVLLAVPSIILLGMDAMTQRQGFVIPSYGFAILFLGYTILILMKYFFVATRVSLNTICGALCVYLLLGVLWAILCSLLEILWPGSYAMNGAQMSGLMRFGGEKSLYSVYYSFVTMTTLGFGDITPVSSMARMFAALEAVMGQVYLAVLVARLVSLQVVQSLQGPASPGR